MPRRGARGVIPRVPVGRHHDPDRRPGSRAPSSRQSCADRRRCTHRGHRSTGRQQRATSGSALWLVPACPVVPVCQRISGARANGFRVGHDSAVCEEFSAQRRRAPVGGMAAMCTPKSKNHANKSANLLQGQLTRTCFASVQCTAAQRRGQTRRVDQRGRRSRAAEGAITRSAEL